MPTPSHPADASAPSASANSGTMAALYQAALGPVQLPRYLALFERFDRLGRAPVGWNFAASLATLNWMLLHHLWTAALIYVALVEGLALLIFGVGRPLLHWPEQVEWGLIAAFALFAIALPGLFGDALLHAEIRKRIARALVAAQSIPQACELLARQASSWQRLRWIAAANVFLFAAMALAWALVPAGGWSPAQPPADAMASGAVQSARPLPRNPLPAPDAAPTAPRAEAESAKEPTTAWPPREAASSAIRVPVLPEPAPTAEEPAAPAEDATSAAAPASGPAPTTPPERSAGKPLAKPPAAATHGSPPAPGASARAGELLGVPAESAGDAASAAPAMPLGRAPGYYLNVGVFADQANARRAQATLLNANLPAFRQTFESKNGVRTRVRVGPFETASEAQKAASQVRSLQLEAVIYRQGR